MGVVGRPHGVRGLVRVQSYTADPRALADYAPLHDDKGRRWSLAWRGDAVAELRDEAGRETVEIRSRGGHRIELSDATGAETVTISDHTGRNLLKLESMGGLVTLKAGLRLVVEAPQVGRKVKAGEAIGVVESVKAASDIYAPVGGEVVAANADLSASPEKVNEDAFASWMFRIKPDNAGDVDKLLDAAAYEKTAS